MRAIIRESLLNELDVLDNNFVGILARELHKLGHDISMDDLAWALMHAEAEIDPPPPAPKEPHLRLVR